LKGASRPPRTFISGTALMKILFKIFFKITLYCKFAAVSSGLVAFLKTSVDSHYDVTKEFTVRRGVLFYCDVVLTISVTCRLKYGPINQTLLGSNI
jgi:hypothetical protein